MKRLLTGLLTSVRSLTQVRTLGVRQYLPALINKLDPVMPTLIAKLSPEDLERKIFDAALSLGATLEEAVRLIKAYEKEYSPIVNCRKIYQPEHLEGED